MVKRIAVFCLVALLVLPLALQAQLRETPQQVFRPEKMYNQPRGFLSALLDNSRFSMSHSYSLNVISMGGHTFNQGLYLNTMNFRLSDPLLMQVRLGYRHQPFGGVGLNQENSGKLFLQRAMLRYEPTKNMVFTIDYQQMPSPMLSPYTTRW
jgi:hypothetical protein